MNDHFFLRANTSTDRTRTWIGLGLWVGFGFWAVQTLAPPLWGGELKRYEFTGTEMAVPIKLLFYTNSSETANTAAHTVFRRIRYLNTVFSDYHGTSEVRRLCDNAVPHAPVHATPELIDVLTYALEVSNHSNGAFDVTAGPLIKLWRRARRREVLPPPEKLKHVKDLTGFSLISIDHKNRTIALKKQGMRIDLGGIAKGYAIDEALRVLREYRITRALVDMGGDMALGDPPPEKKGWTVGLAGFEADSPPRFAPFNGQHGDCHFRRSISIRRN